MKKEEGSIELIVLALLAALIVVLAIPLLTNIGQSTQSSLTSIQEGLQTAAPTP